MDRKMQNHESLEQFIQIAAQDFELQQKLKATTDLEATIRSAVELGKEKGYSFTSSELAKRLDVAATEEETSRELQELDDMELEAVAGGKRVTTRFNGKPIGEGGNC